MSASTHSQSSRSPSTASQSNCLDPLDSLIDFSEYEQVSYQSPSISPASSKPQFVRPVASTPNASNALLPSTQQTLSGPSHNYDLYKQQTGIPSGAIANTLAMNTSSMFNFGYMSGIGAGDDLLDFGSAPTQSSSGFDMDLEFDSPSAEPAFFFPDNSLNSSSEYVNPSVISGHDTQSIQSSTLVPSQTSNVGRLWPGMHQQQAALAKAQQQQKQQQQIIQQQQQRAQSMSQPKQQRTKSHQPTDPIVEEKISQLLNSMRQSSVTTSENDDATTPNGHSHSHRSRKEEEEMDEDERLLASEEGKKLSSKERRQLRNKVSARAFRSRRKEYIGQLEGEIATKVNENSDLRAQNRALLEENTRLSDLTRMLLSSPSFSGFLETLTPNVTAAPQQAAPAPVEQAPAETRQVRKDVNPYLAQQQMQNQQINLAILPDHNMDFSMIDITGDGFNYQPQVFSVLEMPEVAIDASVLSGKTSNFVGSSYESEDEKVELPIIERMPVKEIAPIEVAPVFDEEFDADPEFALFSYATPTKSQSESPADLEITSIFGGIAPEKALARLELVDAATTEATEAIAIARVERLCSSLDDVAARLEMMTLHL